MTFFDKPLWLFTFGYVEKSISVNSIGNDFMIISQTSSGVCRSQCTLGSSIEWWSRSNPPIILTSHPNLSLSSNFLKLPLFRLRTFNKSKQWSQDSVTMEELEPCSQYPTTCKNYREPIRDSKMCHGCLGNLSASDQWWHKIKLWTTRKPFPVDVLMVIFLPVSQMEMVVIGSDSYFQASRVQPSSAGLVFCLLR